MWKYIRLNLFVISKRVSTYLIPVIFVFVLFCVTGLIAMLSGSYTHKSSITHTTKSLLVMPFIVMIVFVSTKVLNIFKDPETDGTELMIASKPITRTKIIFGKFLTLYILIGLFSLFTFLSSLLIAQADKYASSTEVLTFSLSMGFGTWIISMLLSAIVIFFASTMGKIGTTVCSLLVPLIFALTSTTVTGLLQLRLTGSKSVDEYSFIQNTYQIKNNKVVLRKTQPTFIQDVANVKQDDDYQVSLEQQYKKHEAHWYKYAAYADVWNQLTTFYFMFNKSEPSITNPDYKYRVSTSAKASDIIDDEFKVKVNRHTYYNKQIAQYKHLVAPFQDSDNKTIYAEVVYKLKANVRTTGPQDKVDTDALKETQDALTNARTAYKDASPVVKAKIKDAFEHWAHHYVTNQPDLSSETIATQDKLIAAIPKFFGSHAFKNGSRDGDDLTSTMFSYLLLHSLKDGLNMESRSALLSNAGANERSKGSAKFSSELIPIGVKKSETEYRDKSKPQVPDGMSGYDYTIFGSDKPYQEATIKKLVPYKYVPDLLVYFAWPAFTLLMSTLIILRYMKRDFR